MMFKLHILTAVSRPENLEMVGASVMAAIEREPHIDIRWHQLTDYERQFVGGQAIKNRMLLEIDDGWVCILDDDTIMHPLYLQKIYRAHHHHPDAQAILVSQRRTTGTILEAKPENMIQCEVDAGQVVMQRAFIGNTLIPETYAGDGQWIETLFAGRTHLVHYIPEVLSFHNALSGVDCSEPPERMETDRFLAFQPAKET